MKNYRISSNLPAVDERRIQKTIKLGQEYMQTHIPNRTPLLRLFIEQIKYLSPAMWIVQFVVLLLVSFVVVKGASNIENIQNTLFMAAPIIALLAVPEFFKDILFDMSELERSSKNSSGVVLLLRLAAVGGINLVGLAILSGILAHAYQYSFLQLLLSSVVSYNCTVILSLFFVSLFKLKTRAGALMISLTACGAVITISMKTSMVSYMTPVMLLLIFVITLLLLAAQIVQILTNFQKGEDLTWN